MEGKTKLIRLSTNETFILNKIRDCRANMNEAMNSIDDNDISRNVVRGLLEQIEELKTDLNISLESKTNKNLEG